MMKQINFHHFNHLNIKICQPFLMNSNVFNKYFIKYYFYSIIKFIYSKINYNFLKIYIEKEKTKILK